jgi:hypothetical protein
MDISFDVHGNPDPEDVKNLAREKVIVKTELKSTTKSTSAG